MRLTDGPAETDLLPGGYIVSVIRKDTFAVMNTFTNGRIYTTKDAIAHKIKQLMREIDEYKSRLAPNDQGKEFIIVVSEIKYQAGQVVVMTATDPPQEKLE